MALPKAKSRRMKLFFSLILLLFQVQLWSDHSAEKGQILLLIRQGKDEQAFKLYESLHVKTQKHDFELVHRMALGILDFGYRQKDPEIELLSLYGASISAHEDAYYILEESLSSKYPQIQLIALQALAQLKNDRADQAILRTMGSDQLLIRFEAAELLSLKKHPQALNQIESLMYKVPKEIRPLFPPMIAQAETPHANKMLRKLLNDPSENVRISVILSAAKLGRDDLLPQIRQQASHTQNGQQEAVAYALGVLQDEQSRDKLKHLTRSQYPTVALAAQLALYRLGQNEAAKAIEKAAAKGDLFAITALGDIPERSHTLIQLAGNPSLQIRINAIHALLKQQNPQASSYLKEVIIRDQQDLALSQISSPGKVFKAWKAISSSSKLFKDDREAFMVNLEIKEAILIKLRELSESEFIRIADQIFKSQQNDLVPSTVSLLEEMGTPEAIQCLKIHQQQFGAPLIRTYCTIALYHMQEPGPYGEILRKWITTQNKTEFIRFQPFSPWELGKSSYALTPEQTSQLLIKASEALAMKQDDEAISTLIEAITTGHKKNKYALAGLLLHATK